MEEYRIKINEEEFVISVLRMNRKSISLSIEETGFVCKAPSLMRAKDIRIFLENHKSWIYRAAKNRSKKKPIPNLPDRDLTAREKKIIKDLFEYRTGYFASNMGVTFAGISIRNQKTRWGSCSSTGHLNFNYKLYFLPEELRDYVIIHELCHRVHMNHSPEFWGMVQLYCPDYKERKKRLREYE